MPEPIAMWWARRQWSRDRAEPYAVGEFRDAWAPYPVLVRQYHPDLNHWIVLTQIPPAADVWLTWECDAGHRFVATPAEQRARPGRERRRSSWCPECTALARPGSTRVVRAAAEAWARLGATVPAGAPPLPESASPRPAPAFPAPPAGPGGAPGPLVATPGPPRRPGRTRPRASRPVCDRTPRLADGVPFRSECAPAPASAVEAQLRSDLAARLEHTEGMNAVRLARPFHDHVEAWPDIVLPELQVAIEYDSTGRHGLEHVGRREDSDRRKDRALRAVGWEVVRIRTGKLEPLGPWDLQTSGLTRQTIPRLLDVLREIRGPLFVDAYLR
ncbi:hypothetical protein [Curtobacterium sp. RRHDQ10]|uniref:hypothetical protein n=1 Tax=Curtobacterium phyllosphaerae TaxID=3413379 RepID=UPI003BF0EA5B